ncbi:MAG: hypothetical protein ACLGG9_01370 [Thermoleophilia bacterium]
MTADEIRDLVADYNAAEVANRERRRVLYVEFRRRAAAGERTGEALGVRFAHGSLWSSFESPDLPIHDRGPARTITALTGI